MRNETQIISTDLVEKDIKRLNYLESIVLFFIDQNFKLFDSKYDDFYDSNKINNLNLQELEKLLDDMIENRKSSYLAWAIVIYIIFDIIIIIFIIFILYILIRIINKNLFLRLYTS